MSWKKLRSDYVLQSPWLNLRRDAVELPNGKVVEDYYVIEKSDVVLMIVHNERAEIMLKREYRYPYDRVMLEIPGGMYDPATEAAIDAAKRELFEETGYVAEAWEIIGELLVDPTKDVRGIVVCRGRNARKVAEPEENPMEVVEAEFHTVTSIVELIRNGTINVTDSISALFLAILADAQGPTLSPAD